MIVLPLSFLSLCRLPSLLQLLLSRYAVIQLSCLSSLRLLRFGKLLTKTCLLIIIIKQFTLECVSVSSHSFASLPPGGALFVVAACSCSCKCNYCCSCCCCYNWHFLFFVVAVLKCKLRALLTLLGVGQRVKGGGVGGAEGAGVAGRKMSVSRHFFCCCCGYCLWWP